MCAALDVRDAAIRPAARRSSTTSRRPRSRSSDAPTASRVFFADASATATRALRAAAPHGFRRSPRRATSPTRTGRGDRRQDLAPVTVGRITVVPPCRRLGSSTAGPSPDAICRSSSSRRWASAPAITRRRGCAWRRCRRSISRPRSCSTSAPAPACWRSPPRCSAPRGDRHRQRPRRHPVRRSENLALNPAAQRRRRPVRFELRRSPARSALPPRRRRHGQPDRRAAHALVPRHCASMLRTGGTLIVSGLQAHERDEVFAAFGCRAQSGKSAEDGWVGCRLYRSTGRRRLDGGGSLHSLDAALSSFFVAAGMLARRWHRRSWRRRPGQRSRQPPRDDHALRSSDRRSPPAPAGSPASSWPPTPAGR